MYLEGNKITIRYNCVSVNTCISWCFWNNQTYDHFGMQFYCLISVFRNCFSKCHRFTDRVIYGIGKYYLIGCFSSLEGLRKYTNI